MPVQIPTIQTGATPVTILVNPARRQLLVENTDLVNAFTVKWNGSVGAWTMAPGTRLGILLVGGVTQVILTPVAGTPTYQVLLQG